MRSVYLFFLVFVLTIAGWVAWFMIGNKAPEWFVTVLVFLNWFIGPLFTILLARDAKEDLDYENPSGFQWVLARILIGTPLGCFGLASIAIALLMGFVLLKGLLIDRDPEMIPSIPAIGLALGILTFGTACLVGAFRREGLTRQEDEALDAIRSERVEEPDWKFYEEHLDRPVPELLRTHFGKDVGESEIFNVPLDEGEGANAIWSGIHPDELWDFEDETDIVLLPFAEFIDYDGFLALQPGAEVSDQVYFYDQHASRGKNLSVVFESLEEFFESIGPED